MGTALRFLDQEVPDPENPACAVPYLQFFNSIYVNCVPGQFGRASDWIFDTWGGEPPSL